MESSLDLLNSWTLWGAGDWGWERQLSTAGSWGCASGEEAWDQPQRRGGQADKVSLQADVPTSTHLSEDRSASTPAHHQPFPLSFASFQAMIWNSSCAEHHLSHLSLAGAWWHRYIVILFLLWGQAESSGRLNNWRRVAQLIGIIFHISYLIFKAVVKLKDACSSEEKLWQT